MTSLLQYMTQIKDKQAEKERGEWNALEPQQRQENENTLRQITMLARYHNMMGNNTIHALEMITREIKSIFCHKSMVDRIAGMLNYFLLHLVSDIYMLVCVGTQFNYRCTKLLCVWYLYLELFKHTDVGILNWYSHTCIYFLQGT